jgi:hypothetical protein
MFCAQCGQSVPDGAKFCSHCGAATAVASAAPAAAPMSAAAVAPRPEPMAGAAGDSSPAPGYVPPVGDAAHGLIARVKNILLTPSTEWPVIAGESSSTASIYMGYVAPLVAIGAIAAFIGTSMIGLPLVGRLGFVAGFVKAIFSFLLPFVGVFLIAWIVDVLAPTFGAQRNPLAALKVTVYSLTPLWVGSVLNIIPMLGLLVLIIGLYGIYLFYLGLPVLMRCPADKAVGYTVVTVICTIVTLALVTLMLTLTMCAAGGLGLMGAGALGRMSSHTDRASTADAAAVLSNVFGGKSDADKARVNDALKTLEKMGEQAQQADKAAKSGGTGAPGTAPPADVGAALGAVGQIMAGGKDVQPVDFHKLKDMLPESLPGMQRKEAEGQSGEAMGLKGSSATARYSDGANASISIEIADMASLSGLAGLANKFDPNMEKETDTGYERTRRVDGQLVHERYDRRYRSGEVGILLADRFAVTVRGNGVDPEALTSALKQVDLTRLASAAR